MAPGDTTVDTGGEFQKAADQPESGQDGDSGGRESRFPDGPDEFATSVNTRDTSRKIAASISQKHRKAKRNQEKPPLEPEIGLEFTEISFRRTEKRNRQPTSHSMQTLCGHGVRLLCGS